MTRPNRRGSQTRQNMLDAALRALATGDPKAVSANHIAKEVGVTWGAVKYQFGDVDDLWAAVLGYIGERRGELDLRSDADAGLEDRVGQIVDLLWRGLDTIDARAMDTLRGALPRERDELERSFPKTAAELAAAQAGWTKACQQAFADLDVDPVRVREMAAMIPGAMKGLTAERHLSTYSDMDDAKRGLRNAIAAYLSSR
ncbi:TetR/AcrR family transcriptional regulator [Nocardioides marmoriginsengisoli]|uniref:TetR/AcrR family transcriptional regulator n=1 Tax=Nocardioides marmoriginsengisoli TaxID=661483 RepID=UPI001C839A33|nr:TetR family transcriptional regulator [Nocardioides marmoriginsengisoli]